MAKASVKVKKTIKKKPVKAGSSMSKNIGGALTAKIIATKKKVHDG